MIVRPVQGSDLPALMTLARRAGPGFTSLPANDARLAHRIRWAQRTFAGQVERADADYLFVLEDDDQQVIGVSALGGAVGLREPWYNYRVGMERHIQTLFLSNEMTGQSEVCSLFLRPDQRQGHNGRLLSVARFLFVAEYPQLFGEKLIAELRGSADEYGCSPFWDSLGRHFFKRDFGHADHLSSLGSKALIAELLPRQPLYTCLLTEEARAVMGIAHEQAEPARRILCAEGFSHQGYVDIFDAGPVIEAAIPQIRAVRDSLTLSMEIGLRDGTARLPWLIYNRRLESCRVTVAHARRNGQSLEVDRLTAKRLQLQPGSQVRAVPLFEQREVCVQTSEVSDRQQKARV